jgi:Rod binding domain-containing protein
MIPIRSDASPLPVQSRQQVLDESQQRRLKLKKATQAFEAVFIAQLLKSMRSTSFSKEEDGFGKDIMMSMADEGVSQQFAKRGMLGVGKLLYDHLSKRLDAMPENPHQLKMEKAPWLTPHDTPAAVAPHKLKVADSKPVPLAANERVPVHETTDKSQPPRPGVRIEQALSNLTNGK